VYVSEHGVEPKCETFNNINLLQVIANVQEYVFVLEHECISMAI
jgi:hypothetical protein